MIQIASVQNGDMFGCLLKFDLMLLQSRTISVCLTLYSGNPLCRNDLEYFTNDLEYFTRDDMQT